jgi:hypothetical protein
MESVIASVRKMRHVKTCLKSKTMDDSTSLDALLPSPQGPQSAPPLMPMPSVMSPGHAAMAPSFKPSLPAVRWMVSNSTLYISFFLATVILSMSMPRNLLLQYVPNAYTGQGVISWTGAAVLGLAAVVLSNILNNFLSGFLG